MLLRNVVNVESCGPGCRFYVDLACGHRLEWVYIGKTMPARKRCWKCEYVQNFANARPSDYDYLLERSATVPHEDRPNVLFGWIVHCMKAYDMCRRMPGLDVGIALRLTEGQAPYPLLDLEC
jgi:hypothetical protein